MIAIKLETFDLNPAMNAAGFQEDSSLQERYKFVKEELRIPRT